MKWLSLVFALLFVLWGCGPRAVSPRLALPTPTPPVILSPTPTATPQPPVLAGPPAPELSKLGLDLIYDYEVGGMWQYNKNPHPELPDRRFSGVTIGIGYDLHQYSKVVILHDWSMLSDPAPARLSATQPYYGQNAVESWHKVQDILIPWSSATNVFLNCDVAREFAAAKRAFPGFETLSKNCQAALIANGFARGYSTAGPNRDELRQIRDLIPARDYAGIAIQLRKQERIWRGTSIYNGLKARVNAEAKLAETPDES